MFHETSDSGTRAYSGAVAGLVPVALAPVVVPVVLVVPVPVLVPVVLEAVELLPPCTILKSFDCARIPPLVVLSMLTWKPAPVGRDWVMTIWPKDVETLLANTFTDWLFCTYMRLSATGLGGFKTGRKSALTKAMSRRVGSVLTEVHRIVLGPEALQVAFSLGCSTETAHDDAANERRAMYTSDLACMVSARKF